MGLHTDLPIGEKQLSRKTDNIAFLGCIRGTLWLEEVSHELAILGLYRSLATCLIEMWMPHPIAYSQYVLQQP